MRTILYILVFAPVVCFGQTSGITIKTGSTSQTTIEKGGAGSDSLMSLPIVDTTRGKLYNSTYRTKGRIIVDRGDSTKLYYHDGNKWRLVNNEVDTSSLSARIQTNADSITYLGLNYWKNGINAFSGNGQLVMSGSGRLDVGTDSVNQLQFFNSGNSCFGCNGVDNGYFLNVNGQMRAKTLVLDDPTATTYIRIDGATTAYTDYYAAGTGNANGFGGIRLGGGGFLQWFLGRSSSNQTIFPSLGSSLYARNLITGTNVFAISVITNRFGIGVDNATSKLHIKYSTGYNQFRLETSYTPTSTADANGATGDIAWDANYFYVKTAAGWKRAALSTW